MTLTIALTPSEEARLTAVARREGLDPIEAARKLFTACLPPGPESDVSGLHAEADDVPRTLPELASARRRFLGSVPRTPLEADLPAVLLSEG